MTHVLVHRAYDSLGLVLSPRPSGTADGLPLATIDNVLPRSSCEAAGMAAAADHCVLSVDGISAMKMSPGWILDQLQQHPNVEHIVETALPESVSLLSITIDGV